MTLKELKIRREQLFLGYHGFGKKKNLQNVSEEYSSICKKIKELEEDIP